MVTENILASFLRKFDEYPFTVKVKGKEYAIGTGTPLFTVIFHKDIPLADLTASTSIALGEAYMDGNLEIEGDLYFALDHFFGQMGKFQTDESALKISSTVLWKRKTRKGKYRATMTSAMISIRYGWMKYDPQGNKLRADYYRYYIEKKWGDSVNYHLCLDSSVFGIEKCLHH